MSDASPENASIATDQQSLKGVANLLLLQKKLRDVGTLPELTSLIVNDTRLLFQYRTAVLALGNKLVAVSGLPEPVSTAPFTQWMSALCLHAETYDGRDPHPVSPDDVPDNVADRWRDFLPDYALWIPFLDPWDGARGGLFLARENPWRTEEMRMVAHWMDAAAYSIFAIKHRRRRWLPKVNSKYRMALGAAGLVLLIGLFNLPVNLSVLAPAEVVAKSPDVVRAPIDSVVSDVLVTPNQRVEQGDLLLRLDDTSLKARRDVVVQALEIARAERLRAEQASVVDRKASSQLPMLRAEIQKQRAELDYVDTLLGRVEVRAQKAGVVIIPDADALEGLPVKIGQRLMTLANPNSTELEAWLPVGDGLMLPENADVDLFLNIDPIRPLHATLLRVDYQAQVSPDGILAFRTRAQFDATDSPRIGWRGTAKIHGESVPLYYYLLRRPFAAARQWLGL